MPNFSSWLEDAEASYYQNLELNIVETLRRLCDEIFVGEDKQKMKRGFFDE